MKKLIISALIFFSANMLFSQITTISNARTMILSNHNIGLASSLYDDVIPSPMIYDADEDVINEVGAAFTFTYKNGDGGTSYDGYPSGGIGGFKTGGTYYPGNIATSGMPVLLTDLTNSFRIKWKTFQENALDVNPDNIDERDHWWASINIIFDSGANATDEGTTAALCSPNADERDYDIVIEFERYEQDELEDKPRDGIGSSHYFARDENDNIVPLILMIDGEAYEWAVRYKFFDYPVDHNNYPKDNKVHIKFIPTDINHTPPYLDHPLKTFVDATVEYLNYIVLPEDREILAADKVANPNLYVKTISAGYEVYRAYTPGGTVAEDHFCTLGQNYFYSVLDNIMPPAPTNLTAQLNTDLHMQLNWDDAYPTSLLHTNTNQNYEFYNIYRSSDAGVTYTLLSTQVYTEEFIDVSIESGNAYMYKITVLDRSFNESDFSNIAELAPITEFSGMPLTICEGESVTFIDESTNTPTSWAWDFGDGSSVDNNQNPPHTYTLAGDYTVSLTTTNSAGSDLETKIDYITVVAAPNAGTDGTLTVCQGTTPSDTELFSVLNGNPDNGGIWSNIDLIYTYTVAASSPCTDDATAMVIVTEQTAPSAGTNGTLSVCEGITPTESELFSVLSDNPDNGGTWSNIDLIYTYTVAATSPCIDNATATVTVTITPLPLANFDIDASEEPIINFTNTTTGADSYS